MSRSLYVLDNNEQLKAVLSNDGSACPYYESKWSEQLNGEISLEFQVPADHDDAQYLVDDAIVLFEDDSGLFWHEFRIIGVDEDHSDGTLVRVVTCEHAAYHELIDHIIKDKQITGGTAEDALTQVLAGSRWSAGIVDNFGTKDATFYYTNGVAAIQTIVNIWGGELKFRTIVENGVITHRYVDLLVRRGAVTGKRFEYGKDVTSISRMVDSTGVKTALYGLGKSLGTDDYDRTIRITFADIEWKVTNGHPVDKPLGQEWVGDPNALAQYGYNGGTIHRFDVFIDDNEENPDVLLQKTWEKLQEINKPKVQYNAKAIDLFRYLGYEYIHEKAELGDTVYVIDHEFKPELLSAVRIIQVIRDLNDDTNTEFVFGNFVPTMEGLYERVQQIQNTIYEKQGLWESTADPTVTDEDFPDIVPPTPNLIATGGFKTVILEWDYDSASYIAAYEVYGSQTPEFTPSPDNLLFRGKVGSWAHQTDVNQTWYYKVRAVNTRGTAGNYSNEASASTVQIMTDDILFGAVTAQQIADLTITAQKLADGSITTSKIVDGAVVTGKLADLSISAAKLQNGIIDNSKLADLAVTAAKLASGAVDNTKLDRTSPNRIVIDSADIKDAAITSAKVATAAIGTAAIANAAITSAKIADLAVGTAAIADGAITSAQIQDAAITSAKIANLAVGTAAIANGAITNAKIANLAVGTAQIQDLAVTGAKIANLAVDTAKIANGAITNAKIANLAVDDAKIASLHGSKITASSIAADKLNVDTLSAISADLGQVTAGSLTSKTTIDVETKLTVGTEIQIGQSWQESDTKRINFGGIGSGASIIFNPIGDSLSVEAINDVQLSAYQIRLSHQGGGIYNTGSETGFCGVGGQAAVATSGAVAGVGVNFRMRRSYTPSSVSFSQISATASPHVSDITEDGFWLYVVGNNTQGAYRYWRGYYTVT